MSKSSLIQFPHSAVKRAVQKARVDSPAVINARDSLPESTAHIDSYDQWKRAAIAADKAAGMADWRDIEESPLYDYEDIRSRRDKLRQLRKDHDDEGLLFSLNEGVHGNIGGMGNAKLYETARFGTKTLITEYIDAICDGLQHLAQCKSTGLSDAEKTDFFKRARACFGSSALLLSGGGIYGNFHVGVIKALREQDLLPSVMSGSSAGSLIASIIGTHTANELDTVLNDKHLQIEAEYVEKMLRGPIKGLLPEFDIRQISRHIERVIPNLTFEEALQRTGIHINISVSPKEMNQLPRLLNAVTSPHVYVRSAVLASCSVPGVFPPAMLVAKNRNGKPSPYLPTRRWYDGSISHDVPAKRLSRLYGVNHFIVSQVNPFALVLSRDHGKWLKPYSTLINIARQLSLGIATTLQDVFNDHGYRWTGVNFAINSLASVLAQDYKGDINIMPDRGMVKPWRGMMTPSQKEMAEIIHAGERATWPKIEMIRNCTKIGRTLDTILAQREGGPIAGRRISDRALSSAKARARA